MNVFRGFRQEKADDNEQPIVATPDNSGESSNLTNTTNNAVPLREYVMKQGQEKGKIVIDEGKRIIFGIQNRFAGSKENSFALSEDQVRMIVEELPAMDYVAHLMQNIPEELPAMDSVVRLKHQIKSEIEKSKSIQVGLNDRQRLLKGEVEGSFVIKKSQEFLQGYGISFGGLKNKGKPSVPSEDQVKDSLAHLKDQILTAIQQYNSAKESLKNIQDTLDMASA